MQSLLLLPILLSLFLTSCTPAEPVPKEFAAEVLPSPDVSRPTLDVFVLDEDRIVTMDIEEYVTGVVAGEMPRDWPAEALKAQAILARTFVLKFVTEKTSRYPGADISTDIAEAQAYDAAAISEEVRAAVQATAGEILVLEDGTLPYAWFHAHSGGQTASAREGIDWQGVEPAHTRVTDGLDSPDAPLSAQRWEATFTAKEFLAACQSAGCPAESCHVVTTGESGPSGRAITLLVDGTPVNAARLRIALGSTRMRSTMLTSIVTGADSVILTGRGYGHGVGMPQWGAYALAQDGRTGEEIALYYYRNVSLQKAW